jgi:imidazoleglycerol-phosphate dehydratase
MKARGVLVKHIAGLHPLLANCLRLTVGTPDENDAMIRALKDPYEPHRRDPPRHQGNEDPRARRPGRQRPAQLATGIGFFDHMLDQIARHGLIDLEVEAQGDLHIDGHHTVEDVGITLGMAVAQAVGDKKGITRYGHAYVPLDEALSRVVVDFLRPPGPAHGRALQGRHDRRLRHPAGLRVLPGLRQPRAGDAAHRQPEGRQRPPPVRDVFKAFARALRMALDARPAFGRCHPLHQGVALAMPTVAVVDYGMGNLRSVSQAVLHVAAGTGFEVVVTNARRGARRRARGAARPGRDARLHARAARLGPEGRRAARRRRTSR